MPVPSPVRPSCRAFVTSSPSGTGDCTTCTTLGLSSSGLLAFSLAVDPRSRFAGGRSGDQQVRILAIMALTLTLVDCTGDRIKQGVNLRQGNSQHANLLVDPTPIWEL